MPRSWPSRIDVLPLRDFLVRYMPQRVQPPGRYFAYSNYGTALAGHIVERVSGEPYEQYVTKHILEPLEMKRSTVAQPPPAVLLMDTSKGFKYNDGTYTAREIEWVAAAPAGQIRTTATDMATFMLTHLQGGRSGDERLLQEATARDMHAPHFAHDPRLPGMAYGFVVSHENGQEVLWHDGESAQFATYVALLPRQQLGFFVSYNTLGVDPRATFSAFLDRFYPAPETLISRLPTVHSARTSHRAGTYIPMRANFSTSQKLVTWLSPLRVDEEADGTLRIGDQRYVESEVGLFIQVDGERRISFSEDAAGGVTHLFWGPLAYLRVPWYETPSVHGMVLVLCLVTFLSGMVAWPAEALLRRARPRSPSPAAQLARWLAGLLGLLSMLLVAAWVVLMLRFADTYVYPVQSITWLTRSGPAGRAPSAGRRRSGHRLVETRLLEPSMAAPLRNGHARRRRAGRVARVLEVPGYRRMTHGGLSEDVPRSYIEDHLSRQPPREQAGTSGGPPRSPAPRSSGAAARPAPMPIPYRQPARLPRWLRS